MLIKWRWWIILFRTEVKGNPIRLILLLIRLFYPFEKRKEKEKKKRGKEKQFPHNEKRTRTKRNDTKAGRETIESRFW